MYVIREDTVARVDLIVTIQLLNSYRGQGWPRKSQKSLVFWLLARRGAGAVWGPSVAWSAAKKYMDVLFCQNNTGNMLKL